MFIIIEWENWKTRSHKGKHQHIWLHKNFKFHLAKDTRIKIKRETNWREYLQYIHKNKELIFLLYKEVLQINTEKMNITVEKNMNRQFTEKKSKYYSLHEMILNSTDNQRDANGNNNILCFPWYRFGVRQIKNDNNKAQSWWECREMVILMLLAT